MEESIRQDENIAEAAGGTAGALSSQADMSATDEGLTPDLVTLLDQAFGLPEKDWSQYSALTLAFIGDGVYDLIVRTILVKRADVQGEKLHYMKSKIVKAGAQANTIHALLPMLSREEESVYRRGHNSKPANNAKNASRKEYLDATGFEALVGYLYLQRRYERLYELIRAGLEKAGYKL